MGFRGGAGHSCLYSAGAGAQRPWNVHVCVTSGLFAGGSSDLHIEGTLSSGFSAVPPCNAGKLFIAAGFKWRRGTFIEVILLSSETEDDLLSSTFYTLPVCAHACDLGGATLAKLGARIHPRGGFLSYFGWKIQNHLSPCWDISPLCRKWDQIVDSRHSRGWIITVHLFWFHFIWNKSNLYNNTSLQINNLWCSGFLMINLGKILRVRSF